VREYYNTESLVENLEKIYIKTLEEKRAKNG